MDTDPEVKKAIDEAREAARKLPGYEHGAIQAAREAHHTDEGLPELGLAGYWCMDPVHIPDAIASLLPEAFPEGEPDVIEG